MTKNFPDYLKLHVEDQAESGPDLQDVRGLDALCQALETSIGWRLGYGRPRGAVPASPWSMALDEAAEDGTQLWLTPPESGGEALALDRVQPLVAAIGQLLHEVLQAHVAVWRREAELAAGIPVTLRPEDQHALACRLESVLRGGAEAVGCQAAALYLLDDATSYLKLRAAWRIPKHRFLDQPRPLRGSVADLEALVGHAVALEDTSLLPHWRVPESFPAALCVPVSTSTTPLGTLWFFANQVRDFTPEQVHLAEIVAGRLVSDLERDVLMREGLREHHADMASRTWADWQVEQRPRTPPLIDGWQVSGTSSLQDGVTGQFYDWCILPDGRLAVAVGQAEGPIPEAGLTITTLLVAMRAHATYPHEPRQMLDRLSEFLWTHSPGNRFASLFYAVIDPDSGEMQYASAGEIAGVIHGTSTPVPLTDDHPLLGSDPDYRYPPLGSVLAMGQSLVVFTPSHHTSVAEEAGEPDECRVAGVLGVLDNATAEEQSLAVAEELQAISARYHTIVVVRRVF